MPFPRTPHPIREAILARLAQGERLHHICREPGMPGAGTVWRWSREAPAFAERLALAKQRGHDLRRSRFDPAVAADILTRMAEGAPMAEILAREGRPSRRKWRIWLANEPELAEHVFHLKGERRAVAAIRRRREQYRPFDRALADRIIARCHAGVPLARMRQALPQAPSRQILTRWRTEDPEFDGALRTAIRMALTHRHRQRLCTAAIIEAVTDRLAEGETLKAIARDPDMPSYGTLRRWSRERFEFREALQAALHARADMLADEALALAEQRKPGAGVKFHQLRRKVERLDRRVRGEG
jgi:hypothetical protein